MGSEVDDRHKRVVLVHPPAVFPRTAEATKQPARPPLTLKHIHTPSPEL